MVRPPESLARYQLCEEGIQIRFCEQKTTRKTTKTMGGTNKEGHQATPVDSRTLLSGSREVEKINNGECCKALRSTQLSHKNVWFQLTDRLFFKRQFFLSAK